MVSTRKCPVLFLDKWTRGRIKTSVKNKMTLRTPDTILVISCVFCVFVFITCVCSLLFAYYPRSHPPIPPSPQDTSPVVFADVTDEPPNDPKTNAPHPGIDSEWVAFSLSSRQEQLRLPLLMQHPVKQTSIS